MAQVHLYMDFFSVVNTTVLLGQMLVESEDAEEPSIRRANYKLYTD